MRLGVRRQGFLALVPQPIESIREFQMITLLAPAQFGRNVGGQVNAISKSGGNDDHGTVYGFLNASQLNARNFFDTASGNASSPLFAGSQPVLNCGTYQRQHVLLLRQADRFAYKTKAMGKTLSHLVRAIVLGGPLVKETPSRPGRSMFYSLFGRGSRPQCCKRGEFLRCRQ